MLHGAEQFPWIEQIPGKDGMLQSRAVPGKDRMMQSRAVPGQSRFLEKTGCCSAEQFLDCIDSWKRQDAADQSSSQIEQIPGKDRMMQSRAVPGQKDFWKRRNAAEQSISWIVQISGKEGMLQSRAVPGQSRFLEKTGCCKAEQFLDSLDFWKRRDAAEQSTSWIVQISGKDGMLQVRAVPGQNGFLEKTGCCRSEQFQDRIDSWKRQDCYIAEKVVEQSNMWKGEKNSFTFFNMFFSYKNGSETLCTVC